LSPNKYSFDRRIWTCTLRNDKSITQLQFSIYVENNGNNIAAKEFLNANIWKQIFMSCICTTTRLSLAKWCSRGNLRTEICTVT